VAIVWAVYGILNNNEEHITVQSTIMLVWRLLKRVLANDEAETVRGNNLTAL